MDHTTLGRSDLRVSRICLGTMTFGEQVDEAGTFAILDRALERGIDFIDTAEIYAVPTRRETYGASEAMLGRWFAARPGVRDKVVLASKVAGPSRNMNWVRDGATDLKPEHIRQACDDSLRRLQTDRIDLYQIHWPNRNVPIFGPIYFDPALDKACSSTLEQLQALGDLVREGKVRHIGLSNETPWGVADFVRTAEAQGLPRIVSVQNPYALVNRVVDNGLDEMMHRSGVSLLGYSPLAFGALTGKYDDSGYEAEDEALGRMAKFPTMRLQRWGRRETLDAARLYNALAREHGLTPSEMALRFCYGSWRVASTIIGVTSVAQLDQNVDAWGPPLPKDLLAAIDGIRWRHRDPAQ